MLNIPNLDRLISHLEGVPEEKFDMRHIFSERGDHVWFRPDFNKCGTAACIAGWCNVLSHERDDGSIDAARWLGLDGPPHAQLFMPAGYILGSSTYPLSRAIRTLKHMRSEYLRTGQVVVDWDAPEPEAKPAWIAPKAAELTRPALPAEIVRFLRPADLEVVS